MQQVPGTDIVLKPQLCVTVLAQSPSFRMDKQFEGSGRMQMRVLAQGIMLTENNLASSLVRIEAEMREFENDLYSV